MGFDLRGILDLSHHLEKILTFSPLGNALFITYEFVPNFFFFGPREGVVPNLYFIFC